jgi:hypothetical protein
MKLPVIDLLFLILEKANRSYPLCLVIDSYGCVASGPSVDVKATTPVVCLQRVAFEVYRCSLWSLGRLAHRLMWGSGIGTSMVHYMLYGFGRFSLLTATSFRLDQTKVSLGSKNWLKKGSEK